MRYALILAVCAGPVVRAQAVKEYEFHLDNGATVLYQTFAEASARDPNLGMARAFGNTIERTVTDVRIGRKLGFDLRIERLPGDPIRFRVSMGPLDGGLWGYFPQSAPPREVQNGDRVMFQVLEEAITGHKVFDSFQVGIGVPMHQMPAAKTIPQAPPAGTPLHLEVAGKSASGTQVAVAFPARGVFTFSAQPERGSRMEAIAEGNMLSFVWLDSRYDISSTTPVIDKPGAYYLWVRHDPAGRAPANVPTLELSGR